ncbi:hypothetical protein HMPREF9306_01190 [Propionimicrobium lymphophilum ACS-093-V-SCH5]|uniref:Uncharacterized protein n=1 Tax=Propionimicrobium lymphophilum ACS-093-V-SCH5 TaxID=883161 RepID=S2WJQ6_9ACTN|nr:hypothetical protein [Propionimicrobium lymphophilum]EPD32882.1 hypothetical protein HMPREF9306_01190 [Propionimicrobium lymphophilum ACS-093-V-SCH5]
MTDENKYPTLAKYEKIADEWCAIESFLECNDTIIAASRDSTKLQPASSYEIRPASSYELHLSLAKYFDIDLKALEAERRKLLDEVAGA